MAAPPRPRVEDAWRTLLSRSGFTLLRGSAATGSRFHDLPGEETPLRRALPLLRAGREGAGYRSEQPGRRQPHEREEPAARRGLVRVRNQPHDEGDQQAEAHEQPRSRPAGDDERAALRSRRTGERRIVPDLRPTSTRGRSLESRSKLGATPRVERRLEPLPELLRRQAPLAIVPLKLVRGAIALRIPDELAHASMLAPSERHARD